MARYTTPDLMSDQDLLKEDRERQAIEDDSSREWEGSGSPMETFYERWNDIVSEMKRRGLHTTQCKGHAP